MIARTRRANAQNFAVSLLVFEMTLDVAPWNAPVLKLAPVTSGPLWILGSIFGPG